MLTSIDVVDVNFIFDSARLGLFSSANILQIADVALRVVFLLFLPCFQLFLRIVLTLETSEMSAIFVYIREYPPPPPRDCQNHCFKFLTLGMLPKTNQMNINSFFMAFHIITPLIKCSATDKVSNTTYSCHCLLPPLIQTECFA